MSEKVQLESLLDKHGWRFHADSIGKGMLKYKNVLGTINVFGQVVMLTWHYQEEFSREFVAKTINDLQKFDVKGFKLIPPQAAHSEGAEPIWNDPANTIEAALNYEQQLHSLRLAVLEFYNKGQRHSKPLELAIGWSSDDVQDARLLDLALSAGIEFKNGAWILKEGE